MRYRKPIYCVESFWDLRLTRADQLSVRPMLEVLRASSDIRFIHLTSSTREELAFNLRHVARYRSYGLLYLAFHGDDSGAVTLADGTPVEPDELGDMLAGRLDGWFVHFGSCSVALAHDELRRFMRKSGAALVTGYTKDVYWIDSAAMDLLVLDWAQEYKQPRSFVKKLKGTYRGLADETGFDGVFPS
jgi:hypothetical protein